ncbi:MAG: PIN/TRAM domain-containing protein [Syntrophomonadaceae bacterium]|nr:PIN/TRAM domain-containing protein [Syntrophomonadaceae bacterium]
MIKRVIRWGFFLAGAALGFWLSDSIVRSHFVDSFFPQGIPGGYDLAFLVLSALVLAIVTYLLAAPIMKGVVQLAQSTENTLQKVPSQDLLGGALGMIIGLIIAALLDIPLTYIPLVGGYAAILVTLGLGYLGLVLGMRRKDDLLALFHLIPRLGRDKDRWSVPEARGWYKILDTSVIIDGRISDICRSGFIEGILVIPSFVLEELRHIADSADLLKRSRGRRGLDILNAMRKDPGITVEILEVDFEDLSEVDTKLIRLAQKKNASVVTNDYNLNKVAELQGVKVLNINELANAVKPIVLPGEEMTVQVIKDGKEVGQGIGYLDDGTMIVVDGGKRYIGQTIEVFVTSVFQTAAGRMIFARPRNNDRRQYGPAPGGANEVKALG